MQSIYKFYCSAFDYCNRSQFDTFFAYSSRMTSINNIGHIFVRVRSLVIIQFISKEKFKFQNKKSKNTSSVTNLGEAIRIDIPLSSNSFKTSFQSKLRRDFALDKARPAPWHVEPKVLFIPSSVPVKTYEQVPIVPPIRTG